MAFTILFAVVIYKNWFTIRLDSVRVFRINSILSNSITVYDTFFFFLVNAILITRRTNGNRVLLVVEITRFSRVVSANLFPSFGEYFERRRRTDILHVHGRDGLRIPKKMSFRPARVFDTRRLFTRPLVRSFREYIVFCRTGAYDG